MGDVISDHISELLGGQGQPLVDEESEGQEYESQEGDGGGEPPSAEADTPQAGQDEPPAPQAGKRGQKVPLAALQEERTRRQTAETQIQSMQQQQQAMEQRFQQMMELMRQPQQPQQPQPEAPQIPAFIDDPEGHVNALREQFAKQVEQLQQQNQQLMEARQQNDAVQQLAVQSATYEQAFQAQTPDYPQAVDFFAQAKAREYAALGANPLQIQQQIRMDVARIAHLSIQQGKNPAQQMYALATALGYTKAAPVAPKLGVKPPPQALPPKAPTSLSTVEASVKGVDEEGETSLEAVAHMSDAEFDKFWAKMARGSVQRPKF